MSGPPLIRVDDEYVLDGWIVEDAASHRTFAEGAVAARFLGWSTEDARAQPDALYRRRPSVPRGVFLRQSGTLAKVRVAFPAPLEPTSTIGRVAEFVPPDFDVPLGLETSEFVLEPLGPEHNEQDYDAWTSSMKHIA